jgi:hypothetical protein
MLMWDVPTSPFTAVSYILKPTFLSNLYCADISSNTSNTDSSDIYQIEEVQNSENSIMKELSNLYFLLH